MLEQYNFVNEMHSTGNKNCEYYYTFTSNCFRIPNCPTSGPNK